jgi:hypothetical protein
MIISNMTLTRVGVTYKIENTTILMAYVDTKQTIEITSNNNVHVDKGTMEFEFIFNYTKV